MISPPGEIFIFPRGIMEIATFLNLKGCPTSVLPLCHYLRQDYPTDDSRYIIGEIDRREFYPIIEDALREADPMVVGVSNSYTKDFINCMEIIKICKQINPRITTVMGGSHVTFCDEESLQTPELDIVVRGEGEWAMLNILRAMEERREISEIRGITLRKNGRIQRNPPESLGKLEEIPPVDFGLLPREFVQRASIHGILHRGCAYHCRYCAEQKFWGGPRPYRIEKIIEEMKALQREYQTQMIGFEESMLDMRSKSFFDLCQQIKENRLELPDRFYLTTRIDSVTDEGIECLIETNIRQLCVGIESFSPKILKMMNKKQDFDHILGRCKTLKDNKIRLLSYWLIGHPGDNVQEAEYSHSKFKEFFEKGLLKAGYVFIFVPYPGTEYFDHPEKYGIKILTYDWKSWRRWTQTPASCLDDFSTDEIVAAYNRATKMVQYYHKLNKYLHYHMDL